MEDNDSIDRLLTAASSSVRELVAEVRTLVHRLVPDATEEVDASARLIGFTFQPGTYKGLFAAAMLQKDYINLVFSKGVELQEIDSKNLLEGTGKAARHIKIYEIKQLHDPAVHKLITTAAERTPR